MMSRKCWIAALILLLAAGAAATTSDNSDQQEALWQAARDGDLEKINKLLAGGVDVNAATKYGATALSFACDKGHLEVVKQLVDKGADVDLKDSFYNVTPIGWALFNGHATVARFLLESGAGGADQALSTAIRTKDQDLAKAALATGQLDGDAVAQALAQAKITPGAEEIIAILESAEVKPTEKQQIEIDPAELPRLTGTYKNEEIGMTIDVTVQDGKLFAQATGQPAFGVTPLGESRFKAIDVPGLELTFPGRGGMVERLVVDQGGQTLVFQPVTAKQQAGQAAEGQTVGTTAKAAPGTTAGAGEAGATGDVVSEDLPPRNWPSFRGTQASGIADGQGAPVEWDVASGKNVKWKTPIPGIANSSPIIWGERVFVTTAISSAGDDTFRTGLYGDVTSVDDESKHIWKVFCLNRGTGKVIWERAAAEAVPEVKRHLKSSQANSTPATDGKHFVVLLGSIGALLCYDLEGNLLWRTDLGVLDGGWFYDPSYQWGHGSSPVIYKNLVIVQADIRRDSFIAAYDLASGKQVWRTARDEVPSWGTPTVYFGKQRDEVITNGTKVRGYDPATGRELWSLGPNSELVVATPVVADDLFYFTAGYPPVRPIYVVRPGASGDISLAEGQESNASVVWSKGRGGTYIPTPIVYRGHLYTCANNGRLTCYNARTGGQVYRARIGGSGGSFSASPVAADGRLYFAGESGTVYVVQAGSPYEELARNEMGEVIMSTPAISNGVMIVRTLENLWCLSVPTPSS